MEEEPITPRKLKEMEIDDKYQKLFYKICANVLGKQLENWNEISQTSWLDIFNFENNKSEIFEEFYDLALPNVEGLQVAVLPQSKSLRFLKQFLKKSLPSKLEILILGIDNHGLIDMGKYFREVLAASYKVTEELWLYDFVLTESQMKKLFYANRHREYFGFQNCKFLLSQDCDFSKSFKGTNIQSLDFQG